MKSPPEDLAADLLAHSDLVLRSDPIARFDDVATAVGRSRAALYYYFAGRDDLMAFVLQAHVDAGATAMATADPGTGTAAIRLRAMLAAALEYLSTRPQVCAGLLSAAGASGSLAGVLALNDRHIAAPMRALLAQGNRDGSMSVALPDAAADTILGALLLAVIGRWSRGGDPSDGQFRAAVLDQVIAGLRPPA